MLRFIVAFGGLFLQLSAFRTLRPIFRSSRESTIYRNYDNVNINSIPTTYRLAATGSTPTQAETRRKEVLNVLKEIVDPSSGDDLLSAGLLKGLDITLDGIIRIQIDNDDLRALCSEEIKNQLTWVKQVENFMQPVPEAMPVTASVNDGLTGVKYIIAVSSCKGGVGKSTVAVNLAYTLSRAGAKVGILDADIYGPSLPTMTRPVKTDVVYRDNKLQPLEYEGVKLMSMGFINKGASIMRGPMVNQILNQFVQLCDWGELDYLVLDMPPGTGDIQLTLSQILNISAAVIVTTPQRLSFVDVVKGIDLFDTVNIPCVAVVENMAEYSTYNFDATFYDTLRAQIEGAYSAAVLFSPNEITKKDDVLDVITKSSDSISQLIQRAVEKQRRPIRLFGDGHNARLKEMWGIETIVSLPLQESVSQCADKGLPYVLQFPESEVADLMVDLATSVVEEIDRLAQEGGADNGAVRYDPVTDRLLCGESLIVSPFDLRTACRCAVCVEEFTGRTLLDKTKVPKDVKPRSMARIGRYAVSIDWTDGHKSLYPFKSIAKLANSS